MEGTTLHAILAPGKKVLAEKEAAAKKLAGSAPPPKPATPVIEGTATVQ